MKIKVGVFFGGKSVEHEVSVISGIQAMNAFDREKYDPIPIYITKENEMYTGEAIGDIKNYRNIPELLKKNTRIFFICENGKLNLYNISKRNSEIPLSIILTWRFPSCTAQMWRTAPCKVFCVIIMCRLWAATLWLRRHPWINTL